MPILNMVGGGKKGGNIGEPLNLTVTAAGADATITWEDNEIGTIPPTTFVKSELIRKVGSAPTSPSDGTLVVTETVKDTYKVSGYTDSGLTDGTTYYYRVFSYSDLGGISYCDAESVTISIIPYPTNGLIGYYSFENDTDNDTVLHDDSGLGNNGVRDSSYGSIVTGGKVGTNCLYRNTANKTPGRVDRTSTFTYTTAVSVMGWCKSVSPSNNVGLGGFFNWISPYANQRSFALRSGGDAVNFIAGNNSGGDGYDSTDGNMAGDGGVWTHYAVTYDNTHTAKLYRNGTLIKTIDTGYWYSGTSPFYFASIGDGRGGAGYCDDILIYNRVLTDQEISDYYTATV